MARRTPTSPPFAPAELAPEKALRVLQEQLAALDNLRNRRYSDAEHEEDEWRQVTERAIALSFGTPHRQNENFARARSAGEYFMRPDTGIFGGGAYAYGEDSQDQKNYEARIRAYETAMKGAISELKMLAPEPEIQEVYESGDEYAVYRDLKTIFAAAKIEVFVIDNYLNGEIFDLYVDAVSGGVTVRLLTAKTDDKLVLVAQKYAKRGKFELRTGSDVHDRLVFVDDRCWVIGQSLKDAAKKKPTYIIEMDSARLRPIYEDLWNKSKVSVKG